MMRIEKLHLENIGVFDNLEIAFPHCEHPSKADIHLFTGPNGSGKSTLLYALAAALAGPVSPKGTLWLGQPSSLIFPRFRQLNHQAFVEILCEGGQLIHYHREWKDYQARETSYFEPRLPLGPKQGEKLIYAYANTNPDATNHDMNKWNKSDYTFAAFAYSGNRSLNSWDKLKVADFEDNPWQGALSFLDTTDSKKIIQFISNRKTKQALELVKNNLQKAAEYNLVIQTMERIVQETVGWSIEFILESEPFGVFLKVNQRMLEFDVLPDGLKSILSLVTDLLRRLDLIVWTTPKPVLERDFILFLDEIDIHLHPAWQRKVLPVIQKTFPNAQIFVSTHSPFVVGSVSDAWVYNFQLLDNGSANLKKVEKSKAGSSYSLILDEIFGVAETFDEDTERAFREFYDCREKILQGQRNQLPTWLEQARGLMARGTEVAELVGMELRQMSRVLKQELSV
jgi:energy-coupling factor transporter ATP-binding protein EcfA2